MSDLIDRQQAIDALKQCYCGGEDTCGEPWIYEEHAIKAINTLPSVQPMQKEAKWMTAYLDHESMGRRPQILYCSRCDQCAAYPTDFCPACGADMRRLI